ncbi:FAD-binding oxidoreductase [Stenoxybacter acetivorans]|uniref:FAD-binding oxidoreductase n=1 Tax=Stenoxybacter acetivorans TaxID=422441 RepID=UPI00068C5A76|nr:FAD-binding oxidoreductase [Stenoxybacter acetivorans]
MAVFCIDQRARFQADAWAVLQPSTVSDVQALMRYCFHENIPVTPQGGNTGLCGGATPHARLGGKGFIVSLSRLNALRELNLADNAITVEAGMVLAQVQAIAQKAERFFPLSLASEGSCQIGGNIACNAGGLNVVRYGTMRDLVLGLETVLPSGELVSHLQPLHKNTTGYAWQQQITGSEGTLGIITAATLKLFAPPRSVLTAWAGIDNIQAALSLLAAVKNYFAERLSSFEIISNDALQLSAGYSRLNPPVSAVWHVLMEISDSLPCVSNHQEQLFEVLSDADCFNAVIAQSEQERQNLWKLRENISAAQRNLGASIKHDISLPIAAVADFIAECQPIIQQAYPHANIVVFGHLGDGSLHYNVFLPEVLGNDVYRFEEHINILVYECVLKHSGSIAAEHGIGQIKNHWLPRVRTAEEIAWMRSQKHFFDPNNIMNPGKLLPSETDV